MCMLKLFLYIVIYICDASFSRSKNSKSGVLPKSHYNAYFSSSIFRTIYFIFEPIFVKTILVFLFRAELIHISL